MMIPQNSNVRQLVWHLWYVGTAVEDSEVYCYNTKGDRNLVISQASCRMDVTRIYGYIKEEVKRYKFWNY
jgi:hypothetical protein